MSRRDPEQALRAYFGGRLIVITGGSSGIGFAVAQRFRDLGAQIVLLADTPDKLDAAVEALGGSPARVSAIVCDIGDPVAVTHSMEAILSEHGVPDVLINNAGFAVYRAFEQSDAAEIERLFEVNFAGHIRCTKAVLAGMIAKRQGQIVNIVSVAGLFTLTPNAVYGSTKSGIIAWSRALRVELDRYGIGVSVVCPGRVETPFFDHETFRRRKKRRETALTVSMPDVVDAVLDAIQAEPGAGHRASILELVLSTVNALPFGLRAHHALLRRRIDDLYEG